MTSRELGARYAYSPALVASRAWSDGRQGLPLPAKMYSLCQGNCRCSRWAKNRRVETCTRRQFVGLTLGASPVPSPNGKTAPSLVSIASGISSFAVQISKVEVAPFLYEIGGSVPGLS